MKNLNSNKQLVTVHNSINKQQYTTVFKKQWETVLNSSKQY